MALLEKRLQAFGVTIEREGIEHEDDDEDA
jgi:hypothetical protein